MKNFISPFEKVSNSIIAKEGIEEVLKRVSREKIRKKLFLRFHLKTLFRC